jgi:hypothetical protein
MIAGAEAKKRPVFSSLACVPFAPARLSGSLNPSSLEKLRPASHPILLRFVYHLCIIA